MTTQPLVSLDQFPRGRRGRIVRIGGSKFGPPSGETSLEELLLNLGFEEGARVEVRHQGPLGGALAVRVNQRLIALRSTDAAAVLVEPEASPQPDTADRTG